MVKLIAEIHNIHDVEVNQKYGGYLPYSFHLKIVQAQAIRFSGLLDNINNRRICVLASIGHDLIEDTRMTYKDVLELYGKYEDQRNSKIIADIIFLCTDFKGKTREERKPIEFYKNLAQDDLAVYVKLCDMIANKYYSCMTNSKMKTKYNEEYPKFKEFCYKVKFEPMFNLLEKID